MVISFIFVIDLTVKCQQNDVVSLVSLLMGVLSMIMLVIGFVDFQGRLVELLV
jgi:hypothetical protein